MVAINKPSGLLVHRSPVDRHETRFALQMVRDQIGSRVYPLHRLDKPTSGVLLFGLSPDIARVLTEQWHTRTCQKHYLAVVRGWPPSSGEINHAFRDDEDSRVQRSENAPPPLKEARTTFQTLASTELPVEIERYPQSRYSLLCCQPLTGRRHQIRRHMKHIGHPILGDAKHGRGRHNRYFRDHLQANRLLLHAVSLQFDHPVTGAATVIDAPLDRTLYGLLNRFRWLDALPTQWQTAPPD